MEKQKRHEDETLLALRRRHTENMGGTYVVYAITKEGSNRALSRA